MKTFIVILILVLLGAAAWWVSTGNLPDRTTEVPVEKAELCYFKAAGSADSEFEDKYSLRVSIDGDTATGEMKMLPAEKDALVGTFEGPAGESNAGVRALTVWWNAEGEGMTSKQELKMILEPSQAKVGFGEMSDRGDGVYVYKDPAKINYSLSIPSVPCVEQTERQGVEKMLWENITVLSPVAPVLGGNWYVVSADIDLENNKGEVVYEDGHIQEKRSFFYTAGSDGVVQSLTIE